MLFRGSKPIEITLTGYQFFSGFEVAKEIVGMVEADICRTAAKSLVSDGVLLTVLAFYFFRHGNSSVLLFIDTFPDPLDGGKRASDGYYG
jgi:hypothetical protein